MFFRKKKVNKSVDIVQYDNRILAAIEDLEIGNVLNLSMAYRCLETKDIIMIQRFSKALNHILDIYTIKQKIRLESSVKKYYGLGPINVDFNTIKEIVDQESFRNILIIGSFLSDGYYREDCLLQLRFYENTLLYIILRLNDWVKEIRNLAETILEEQLKKYNYRRSV